jgi:hypothetical protein
MKSSSPQDIRDKKKAFVEREFWRAIFHILQERDESAGGIVLENGFTILPNEKALNMRLKFDKRESKEAYHTVLEDWKQKIGERKRIGGRCYNEERLTEEEYKVAFPEDTELIGIEGFIWNRETKFFERFSFKRNNEKS